MEPASLAIRRAQPSDAATVATLGRTSFAETFASHFAAHPNDLEAYLDRTFSISKIQASLAQPENSYWLATLSGEPAGFAKLKHPSPREPLPDPLAAQLQKIYLLQQFVNQGAGRPLLHAMLTHAVSLGSRQVWLDVLKQNARAIRFYQREGFTAFGDDTYTIGAQTFHFHLMVLDLASA